MCGFWFPFGEFNFPPEGFAFVLLFNIYPIMFFLCVFPLLRWSRLSCVFLFVLFSGGMLFVSIPMVSRRIFWRFVSGFCFRCFFCFLSLFVVVPYDMSIHVCVVLWVFGFSTYIAGPFLRFYVECCLFPHCCCCLERHPLLIILLWRVCFPLFKSLSCFSV